MARAKAKREDNNSVQFESKKEVEANVIKSDAKESAKPGYLISRLNYPTAVFFKKNGKRDSIGLEGRSFIEIEDYNLFEALPDGVTFQSK